MANEYLKRQPTSTGNNRVLTWSGWVRRHKFSNAYTGSQNFFRASNGSGGDCGWRFDYSTPADGLRVHLNGSASGNVQGDAKHRDPSSWMNVMLSFNSTLEQSSARVRMYIDGVLMPDNNTGYPTQNYETSWNELVPQYIGTYDGSTEFFHGEMCDIFMVDGQALTPDVFGFYKEGKGYQSSGTTKATDFRPGQWVPKAPRTIKSEINRRGGFGVNGFYLPMNDSSNFGADFHCAPNSIIKLKGEDLPQPRNGLPTTSDDYVSQLREDPYAANLVLAVPGVNTQPTGSELVTNGTFDTNVSGWTITDTGTIVRQSDGTAKVTRGSSAEVVYQDITTVVGTTYELSVDITDIAGSHGQVYVRSTPHSGSLNTNIGYSFYTGTYKGTFTADTTTTRIILYAHPSGSTSYDNVSVKATTIPDYSADIKGSGTNKTLIVNGGAGIRNNDTSGSAVNGYYGNALTFGGSSDYFDAGSSSDFDFGSGDFTIEYWQNVSSFASTPGFGIWDNVNNQRSWLIYQNSSALPRFYTSVDGTSSVAINATGPTIPTNQWTHFCMERNGSNLVGYVNGVCVGVNPNLGTQSLFTPADPFLIGKWETSYYVNGEIQDLRVYKGVAKYKGGFDVPKPYSPIGIENWRQIPDTCKNNFATLNPLSYQTTGTYGSSVPILSDGNLTYTHGQTGQWERSNSTMGVGEGKWYFEFEVVTRPVTGNSENWAVGLRESDSSLFHQCTDAFEDLGDHVYWIDAGTAKIVSNQDRSAGSTSGITAVANGDIINIAFEKTATALKVWFGKNGTYFNSGNPATGSNPAVNHSTTSTFIIPVVAYYQYSGQEEPVATFNFGQNPTFSGTKTAENYTDSNGKGLFKYQPPTGYLALCEDNLPAPAIADPGEHFKTVLYRGNGGHQSVNGVGFQPDLVWIKSRTSNHGFGFFDVNRGIERLDTSATQEGRTNEGNIVISSDGFDITSSHPTTNNNDSEMVAWCWKAGGAAVANTDGSIAAQISVNQDAGFSILSYTGNGTSGTVGHGLGKTPNIVICKNRTDTSTNWSVNGNVAGLIYGTNKLILQQTVAIVTDTNEVTSANATTITLGNSSATNDTNDAQIAYCWTEVSGFSKFGTYTGTGGADGAFVNCGFKPAFLMIKRTDAAGEWWMYDSSRGPTNPIPRMLMANSSAIEQEDSSSYLLDFVSNGFKWRSGLAASNGSGNTYLYMAFAESPFQTANAK